MRLTPLIRVYWNIPKGPKAPLYRQFKYFNLAEPEKYGFTGLKSGVSKPVALAKNLLHDAPELFTMTLLAFIGYAWLFYLYFQEEQKGIFKGTPYKVDFIVVRPDDPMVSAVVNRNPEYYENKMTEPVPQYPKSADGHVPRYPL